MIKEWFHINDKIALIYKEVSYDYHQIIDLSKGHLSDVYIKNNVLCCSSEDLFVQFLAVIKGLNEGYAIYFGEGNELSKIERANLETVFLVAKTSGTTGRKKMIFKRKEQWLESFDPYSETFDIGGSDRIFINGSLAYTANLYSVLHMLYCHGTVLLSADKNPRKWIEDIEQHKCTIAYLVPSKLRLISKAITKVWDYSIGITTAGEALSTTVLKKLYIQCPKLKVHHYYGAAEIGHISAITDNELRLRPTSVGRAFKGVTIRIRQGLIYASSPYSLSAGNQYDSAYDYGILDEEGYLYVTGRKDTQINVHGRKFDALEVVDQLKSIEGIEDILFIASKKSQEVGGKTYHLYIISELTTLIERVEEAVKSYLIECIPQWQWPEQIKVVTNGIYSETGKYDMVKIENLFTN